MNNLLEKLTKEDLIIVPPKIHGVCQRSMNKLIAPYIYFFQYNDGLNYHDFRRGWLIVLSAYKCWRQYVFGYDNPIFKDLFWEALNQSSFENGNWI